MNGPRLPGACAARAAAPKRARRQASEDTISPDYSIFRDSTESAVPAAAGYAAENEKGPRDARAFSAAIRLEPDGAQNDATIEPLNCFVMNSFTFGDWYAFTSFFTHG